MQSVAKNQEMITVSAIYATAHHFLLERTLASNYPTPSFFISEEIEPMRI